MSVRGIRRIVRQQLYTQSKIDPFPAYSYCKLRVAGLIAVFKTAADEGSCLKSMFRADRLFGLIGDISI